MLLGIKEQHLIDPISHCVPQSGRRVTDLIRPFAHGARARLKCSLMPKY